MLKKTAGMAMIAALTTLGWSGAAGAQQVVEVKVEPPVRVERSLLTEVKETVRLQAGDLPLKTPEETINAGAGLSQQQALERAYELFPELPRDGQLEVGYEDHRPGRSAWRVSYTNRRPGRQTGLEFYMSLDAKTGELLSLNYRPPADEGSAGNIVTREQGRRLAEDFLRRVHPEKLRQCRFDENTAGYYGEGLNTTYQYSYSRVANNLPVQWQGIYVSVDALTGKISSLYMEWEEVKIPAPGDVVAKEDLSQKLVEELGLYPAYVVSPQEQAVATKLPRAKIVYMLNSSAPFINAANGKPLTHAGEEIDIQDARSFTDEIVPAQGDGNNEPPARPLGKIDPGQAKKKAEDFLRAMGSTGEVHHSGGGTSSGPGFYDEHWTYSVTTGTGTRDSMQVQIDAFTGRITGFSKWPPSDPLSPGAKTIEPGEALKKARETIALINPERLNSIILQNNNYYAKPEGAYDFSFVSLVNGIPYGNDAISITVDAVSGEVTRYHCHRQPAAGFQPVTEMIAAEAAAEQFIKQAPLELAYYVPRDQNTAAVSGQALTVYQLSSLGMVDAVTGQLVELSPREVPGADGFEGHWAGPALRLLAGSGLLPGDSDFSPDQAVTRRESIRIITTAAGRYYQPETAQIELNFRDINKGDPDYYALQVAVAAGLLQNTDRFEPEAVLSREELAVWLARGLGFGRITGMSNRIETPFGDAGEISAGAINSVGLVNGLGFMNADSKGNFRPRDGVTWAELAVLALKTAPELQRNLGY